MNEKTVAMPTVPICLIFYICFRYKQQLMVFERLLLREQVVYRKKCPLPRNLLYQSKNNGLFTWKKQKITIKTIQQRWKAANAPWKKVLGTGMKNTGMESFISFLTLDSAFLILLYVGPCSLAKARMGSEQWQNAQSALVSLGKENLSSVESIIR